MDDKIDRDIALGSKRLVQLAGAADGLQVTGDERGNVRHFANTLFNIMRGVSSMKTTKLKKPILSPISKSQPRRRQYKVGNPRRTPRDVYCKGS